MPITLVYPCKKTLMVINLYTWAKKKHTLKEMDVQNSLMRQCTQ